MENECEALPGVAYPGVRDNRSTINTKTGYDDDDIYLLFLLCCPRFCAIITSTYQQVRGTAMLSIASLKGGA